MKMSQGKLKQFEGPQKSIICIFTITYFIMNSTNKMLTKALTVSLFLFFPFSWEKEYWGLLRGQKH